MADSPLSDTFRVTTATHAAAAFNDTIGGSIDETIGWVESRPGARLSPAIAIDSYGMSATIRFSKRQVPVVRGTSGTLTFNVLQIDNTGGTVVCATMLAGEYHANFNAKPHEHEQHFQFSAGNTENLAPVSIT